MSEQVAAGGAVGELDALARTEEVHGVIADHVPAAQREHTELVDGCGECQAELDAVEDEKPKRSRRS